MDEAKDYEEVERMIGEAKVGGRAYWLSRTPQERMRAVEFMRQKAYGYDPATTRIQKFLKLFNSKRNEYLLSATPPSSRLKN